MKIVLNLDLGGQGGKHLLKLENRVLDHTTDGQANDADAAVRPSSPNGSSAAAKWVALHGQAR